MASYRCFCCGKTNKETKLWLLVDVETGDEYIICWDCYENEEYEKRKEITE